MNFRTITPIIPIALFLFVLFACHPGGKSVPDDKPIECSVNPDEVFGVHYGPQDFQIHNILDHSSAEWSVYITWLQILPEGIVSQDGRDVLVSDTALFAPFIDSLACKLGDATSDYIFSWLPLEDYETPLYKFLAVNTTPLLDGTSVVESSAVISSYTQEPVLNFAFDDSTAKRWYLITNDNVGRNIAITLGRRTLSAPMVMAAIEGGRCSVSGLTEEETCAVAAILSAGTGHIDK